jgi:hypothetical protein
MRVQLLLVGVVGVAAAKMVDRGMVEDLELVQVLANIITMVERQGLVAMVVAAVEGKVEVLGDLWVMGLVVALDLALALVIQGTITMVI